MLTSVKSFDMFGSFFTTIRHLNTIKNIGNSGVLEYVGNGKMLNKIQQNQRINLTKNAAAHMKYVQIFRKVLLKFRLKDLCFALSSSSCSRLSLPHFPLYLDIHNSKCIDMVGSITHLKKVFFFL